jgi:hypothetical protein
LPATRVSQNSEMLYYQAITKTPFCRNPKPSKSFKDKLL